MKKAAAVVSILGLTALAAPALSSATGAVPAQRLTAAMSPRQVVTPSNKPASFPSAVAKAAGTFSGTTSSDGRTLKWHISYSNVGHPALAIADIHVGKPGKFGPVYVRLCAPCKPGQSGVTKLKSGYAGFGTGIYWITLTTEKYPNGLLRGQIKTK